MSDPVCSRPASAWPKRSGKSVGKRMVRLMSFFLLAYGLVIVGGRLFYPLLLYHPVKEVKITPEALGVVDDEDVWLTASDGCRINGWFVPAAAGARTGATLLAFHGNAGNLATALQRIMVYRNAGFDVFMIDYHGYGKSEGKPNEEALYRDALAAWSHVVDQRGVPKENVIILGYSLGGAVAAWLAAEQPEVGGLVLESTFTRLADVAGQLFPWLPTGWIVGDAFDTLDRLDAIDCPVLVVHGRGDRLVAFENGERLFAAYAGDKRFLEIAADHNTGFMLSREAYVGALVDFAGVVLSAPGDAGLEPAAADAGAL